MKKIAIFVDVQNIYYTTKQAFGQKFDYSKLWKEISKQGQIIKAYAYAIDRQDKKQLEFQSALAATGFEVKLKPFIQRSDGSAKGDWDVGITIDILEIAPTVDTVILLSGDGDFDLLLKNVRRKAKTFTEVYGVPKLTADSLINSADVFHQIDESYLMSNYKP